MSGRKRKLFIVFFVVVGFVVAAAIVKQHIRFNPWPLTRQPRNPLPPPSSKGFHVIVEKSARRLTVYDGDKVVKTCRASFGTGKGDKVREGDGRTPEGDFYVCYKNDRSRFTLSLGLSYPNVEDAQRGLRDGLIDQARHDAIAEAIRQRRRPPWNTPLGGEIMIHGCGSDRDWTVGCISLDDDDIKELFAALPMGTPVTIRP